MEAVDKARAMFVAEKMDEAIALGTRIGELMQTSFNAGWHAGYLAGAHVGAQTTILGQMTLPFNERDDT